MKNIFRNHTFVALLKNWIANILLYLLVVGCQSKTDLPKGIIPREKMIDIMVEIQLAEAHIETLQLKDSLSNKRAFEYYHHICYIYKTDTTALRKSFEYYGKQISVYDEMQEEIITRLQKMK